MKTLESIPGDPLPNIKEIKTETNFLGDPYELLEKLGDHPEWMKITAYREEWDSVSHRPKSEMMLDLTGKNYWFPITRNVYERFLVKSITESRGVGLRYLQRYIRRWRTYKERWPSMRYVNKNRLRKNSFMGESVNVTDLAGRIGLPAETVARILSLLDEGMSFEGISRELHVSVPHLESMVNLLSLVGDRSFTDPSPGEIKGVLSVDEEIDNLLNVMEKMSNESEAKDAGEAYRSRMTFQKLSKFRDPTARFVRPKKLAKVRPGKPLRLKRSMI